MIFVFSIALFFAEYSSYRSGCVAHVTNSTFFSSLMFSASFNLAAMEANYKNGVGISKYNSELTSLCSSGVASSEKLFRQSLSDFSIANQTFDVSVQLLDCFSFVYLD